MKDNGSQIEKLMSICFEILGS